MIKKYLTNRKIGNDFYAEYIYAKSWLEAQLICLRSGVELLGEHQFTVSSFSGMLFIANFIVWWKNSRRNAILR